MNKETLLQKFGYFDMVHNVTLKAVAQLKDDQLDFRPSPDIRTVRELLSHLFGQEKALVGSIPRGQLSNEDMSSAESKGLSAKTVADMIAFGRDCHQSAKTALEKATNDQVAGNVKAFFGDYPGWQLANFSYDEHWHHRGQFYTYLRLMGIEPVSLYSYE